MSGAVGADLTAGSTQRPRQPLQLLMPIRVGTTLLKNRVVMGSMHTRLEMEDNGLEREIAFYSARAAGGVALIVTSGCAPNAEGRMEEGAHQLDDEATARAWQPLTRAVHEAGSRMVLQILHAGRYARHDGEPVAPSALRAPINPRMPRAMDEADIARTIGDFVRCAELAQLAGFDGVEVMASEGYLINEFTAPRTNRRTDQWGGSVENRCRFGREIVAGIRARLGPDFLILYRISAVDLVEDGRSTDDIDYEARTIAAAGADALDTGIGWHEARVPTIAYQVPRAAFRYATARLKCAVEIPVIATNRINTPELAEDLIASGDADLVALARPLLADPDFVAKTAQGRAVEINPCIACNQACLDYIFTNRSVSCLVNPRAGRELEFALVPAAKPRRVAVVGAGPAGMSCAIEAAARGHAVTLFDAAADIGGQLNLAARVPGKDEFEGLLRYFRQRLAATGVRLQLGARVNAEMLAAAGFERVVVAAGIVPRRPDIPGIDHPRVLSYHEVLSGKAVPGRRVAIIGAGGIGWDLAELLTHDAAHDARTPAAFFAEWGVDPSMRAPGGLVPTSAAGAPVAVREVTLLQRGTGRPGASLGATTGWILRARLARRGVQILAGCKYLRIDDAGLHVEVAGAERVLAVDHVVIAAGQEPARELVDGLAACGIEAVAIGGAREAKGLDAHAAIGDGLRAALAL